MRRTILAVLLAMAMTLVFAPVAEAAKPTAPPPVVTSISASYGSPGTEVTLYGSGFGRQKRNSIVWFNGEKAHFTSWTDTEVSFKVPAGVDAGYVGVQNNAGCSNGFYFIPFEAPVVTAVSHAGQAVGQDIEIAGNTFEPEQGDGWVSFSGTPGVVKSWSDTLIVATVPEGASAGYVGVVQHDISSNGTYFSPYYQPVVDSMSRSYGLVGDTVTLTGSHFGEEPGSVAIGGEQYSADSWSDTEVVFTVPDDARSGYAGVVRDGMTSNGIWLTIAPRVDSLSTWWAGHGAQVTVQGRGFGSAEGSPYTLLVGGQEVPADSWSPDMVTFTVPAGAQSGYVGFTNGDRAETSNGVWLLVLDSAVITGVSASDVAPASTITVSGTDFGPAGPDSTLRIGDIVLSVSSWTDTQIVATVPSSPVYGYLGVWKSGVASNGVLVSVAEPPPADPLAPASITQAQAQTAPGVSGSD
jgi:hypothetical protein